jgi:small-conductance mechanosensitive channel
MTQTTRGAIAACLAVLVLSLPSPVAGQAQQGGPPTGAEAAPQDPEAGQEPPAPVLLDDVPIVWVPTGVGPYSAQARAERITRRVEEVIRDRSIKDLTVTVTEAQGSSELRVGTRLLMVVTQNDAAVLGVSRASLAQQFSTEFQTALQRERLRYAPGTLIRSAAYAFVATMLFILAIWITRRLTRALHRVILRGVEARSESLRAIQAEMLADDRIGRGLTAAMRALRVVVIVLLLDLYLTYSLGLFPWTSPIGRKLLPFAITPLMAVVRAFVGYLPNFFFMVVITAVFYVAIKLVGLFFRQIELGRLVFQNFPAEWADPTNKIVRVLLIAFGLVVAFPYLPASNSPAFAGVSVFIGVLFSLASSSALSNMIAGTVLTYTGAFRVGERVKVGDAFGDIIETSLLVTRVRTIKNENITIPNGLVLGSAVTNYSRSASTLGLILHTSVTIGYDAPWRKIHDLLIAAARNTPGILDEPRPFVWQTALNDFYVTYEINAYTNTPRDMIEIYAALHARIQDTFYAAGVEIMSPHFTAIRDGNTIAIPEGSRPPGYRAPSFRVENTASVAADLPDSPGVTRRS